MNRSSRITRVDCLGEPMWQRVDHHGRRFVGKSLLHMEESQESAQEWPPLPPVQPSKIICIGLNYRRHAEEMNKPLPKEPLIFMKPTSAIIGNGEPIQLPASSQDVHYEGELAVIIGSRATAVSAADAMNHVLGFTLMNDVTARDIQRAQARYTHAKGFDTFAPVGPAIVTGLEPKMLSIRTHVNGQLRQESSCDDMIFTVAECISFISGIMTLLPGDIISTGTPAGVGSLHPGDVVSISIDEIGVLTNPVVASSVR
jgi:2-keto-4-pentenoate hydratase/2-oxohepta-3-ene-1,7-dioic acid hydratase in catechol pathway